MESGFPLICQWGDLDLPGFNIRCDPTGGAPSLGRVPGCSGAVDLSQPARVEDWWLPLSFGAVPRQVFWRRPSSGLRRAEAVGVSVGVRDH